MDFLRNDLQHLENYKVMDEAVHNLGDNENRLIDWSFLLDKLASKLQITDLTYYGDNRYQELLESYASYIGYPSNYLVQGVGSDQLLHMVLTTFLQTGDQLLTLDPDFFMYQVYSQLQEIKVFGVPLDEKENGLLSFPLERLLAKAEETNSKMILFSNPNNPSSVAYPRLVIESLLQSYQGIVVVDEAYIDFAEVESVIELVEHYPNLIVLRTLSKAFGLAGLRLGFAICQPHLAQAIDKVLPPYSMPNIVARIGSLALENHSKVTSSVAAIKAIRQDFSAFLTSLPEMRVLPSQTNFLTFTSPYAEEIFRQASEKGYRFKYYQTGFLKNYIRLSIGWAEEMEGLKEIIREIVEKKTGWDYISSTS